MTRWLTRRRQRDDIGDELRAHITKRAADIAAGGVASEDAMRRASEEFGALERYEAQCRREQRLGRMTRFANGLAGDFVHAWRRLRATPVFTVFAIVSLAIGVGVTTAMYSVVREVFWKSSGVPSPERVAFLFGPPAFKGSAPTWRSVVSRTDFDELRAAQTSFDRLAGSAVFYQGLNDARLAEAIQGEAVTGTYFETLGVTPAAGRALDENDDRAQAPVAVLSHTFWRTRFDGDPAAIGKVVRIGGHPFEVVGVAAPSFDGITMMLPRFTSVWIPLRSLPLLRHGPSASPAPASDVRDLTVIGRLPAGRTVEQASAELSAIGRQLDQALPARIRAFNTPGDPSAWSWEPIKRNWHVRTVDATFAQLTGMGPRFGLIVLLLVVMVLLVACTNLANLTLARGLRRRNDLMVRRALGASRWRLVREQTVESAIIAALGGVGAFIAAGIMLALVGNELVVGQGGALLVDTRLDLTALAVAAAAVALSLIVFGVTPAMQVTRGDKRGDAMHLGGAVGPAHARSQRRVIRSQVAIACSFLVFSTLAMQAVMKNARHDSGIDLDRLAIGAVDFAVLKWDEAHVRRTVGAIREAGRKHAALESLAVSSGLPFGTTLTPGSRLVRSGTAFRNDRHDPWAFTIAATPEIFRTLGISLLKGRLFDDRDAAGAPPVIVLSAKTARELFGAADPIGEDVLFRIDTRRSQAAARASVIGIVSDTDSQFLTRRSNGGIYLPFAQHFEPRLTIVGRAASDTRNALDAVRASIRAADPEIAIYRSGTGLTMLGGFFYTAQIAAYVSGSLGLLALVLSMIGLHGVLAQIVAMNTREVGLRLALGASREQIRRMVMGSGFVPVLQGLFAGVFLGTLARFVVRAKAYPDLPVFDALTFVLIPLVAAAAAFLACYLPARRAAEVDPNVALRAL